MRPEEGQAADWKDAEAYAPLLEADRSIFAWEWLRRDPAYRNAAEAAVCPGSRGFGNSRWSIAAERWGLHAFEPPDLPAPLARPVWSADVHASVIGAVASGAADAGDRFDLERFAGIGRLVRGRHRREHLLLSDGLRTVRLDVLCGTLTRGPVHLHYLLSGFASAERPLLTLRRLMAFAQTGRFSRSLHRREVKARRWILLLRAHDALAAGANQREIAAALLNSLAGEPHWRTDASSLRSQAQRLVRGAVRMAVDGYRDLLE